MKELIEEININIIQQIIIQEPNWKWNFRKLDILSQLFI